MSEVVVGALGTITVLSVAVILFLVLFTTSEPCRVRLAKVCAWTALVGFVAWLIAAAVLP